MKALAIILALTQLLCSCVAYQDIGSPTPEAIHELIEVGELVKIVTVEDQVYNSKVQELNLDYLVLATGNGPKNYIRYSDIKQIQKGTPQPNKTAWLIIGIATGLFGLLFVVAFATDCPDGCPILFN